MTQQDLVRFPARLDPALHGDLAKYAEQNNVSINTAINQLLRFSLKYGLQGEGNILDSVLSGFKSNLIKANYILEQFIQDEVTKDFENLNSSLYLDYISKKFETLDLQDRKLLSELAYSLAMKNVK